MLVNWWGISWPSTTVSVESLSGLGGGPILTCDQHTGEVTRWSIRFYTYMTYMRWEIRCTDVLSVCTYISYISTSCLPVLSWKGLLGWPPRITMVRSTKCMMPPGHLQVGLDPEAFCDYAPHRRQTWRPEVGSSREVSFGTCRMKASFLYLNQTWGDILDIPTGCHQFPSISHQLNWPRLLLSVSVTRWPPAFVERWCLSQHGSRSV